MTSLALIFCYRKVNEIFVIFEDAKTFCVCLYCKLVMNRYIVTLHNNKLLDK